MTRPQPPTCAGVAHEADAWTAHADTGRSAVAILAAAVDDIRWIDGQPALRDLAGVRAITETLVPANLCQPCVVDLLVHLAASAAQVIPHRRRAEAAAQMRRRQLHLGLE